MKQKNNNVNPFNYPAKKYSSYVFDATTKYQKKYGFEMGTGSHATWNNEADAFKHTYMQAQLALFAGKHIAKFAGDYHEIAILAQMNTIGVPYDKDVPNRVNTYSKEKKDKKF